MISYDLRVHTCPSCCMELLSGFLARIMAPLEVSVLGTPATALVHEKEVEEPSVRRSGRIAKLHPEGANIEKLAMECNSPDLVP